MLKQNSSENVFFFLFLGFETKSLLFRVFNNIFILSVLGTSLDIVKFGSYFKNSNFLFKLGEGKKSVLHKTIEKKKCKNIIRFFCNTLTRITRTHTHTHTCTHMHRNYAYYAKCCFTQF